MRGALVRCHRCLTLLLFSSLLRVISNLISTVNLPSHFSSSLASHFHSHSQRHFHSHFQRRFHSHSPESLLSHFNSQFPESLAFTTPMHLTLASARFRPSAISTNRPIASRLISSTHLDAMEAGWSSGSGSVMYLSQVSGLQGKVLMRICCGRSLDTQLAFVLIQ
jgi:hypothetical protein